MSIKIDVLEPGDIKREDLHVHLKLVRHLGGETTVHIMGRVGTDIMSIAETVDTKKGSYTHRNPCRYFRGQIQMDEKGRILCEDDAEATFI